MDVEDDFGGHIRQAIICDDAVWMVVPLAAVGDELERSELEPYESDSFAELST